MGRTDPVGEEAGVVVGLGEARPIEEVAELRRCVRGWAGLELRLDPIEHIPHALVRYVSGKGVHHPRRTAREARTKLASGQRGFKECLRRDWVERLVFAQVWICRKGIESLSKALPAGGHEERHLIQIDALVNIPGGMADVADFHTAVSRQLALNGEIPLVMRTRRPLWILYLRVGNERNVGAGDQGIAGHYRGSDARGNVGQRDRTPVEPRRNGPNAERGAGVGSTIPLAGVGAGGVLG